MCQQRRLPRRRHASRGVGARTASCLTREASACTRRIGRPAARFRYGRIGCMCRTGYVPFIGNWRSRLLQDVHGLVLEVGAGSGPNLDHYPRAARVIASEFNEESIALARPRSNAHIRLASADIEHLAFPDNTFDAGVATLVFCSVERPIAGFQEVRRVLKPGGQTASHRARAQPPCRVGPAARPAESALERLGRGLQPQSRYGSECAPGRFCSTIGARELSRPDQDHDRAQADHLTWTNG